MALVAQRKLTEILTIGPYVGYHLKDIPTFLRYVETFIKRTKKWLPYVIYETWNEPSGTPEEQVAASRRIVDILQAEGVPNAHIQIPYSDSSDFAMLLVNQMKGEGLACLHWVGSMETIQLSTERGQAWEGSSGTEWLMRNGLYGSNDGEDTQGAARGLNWWHREQVGCQKYRRPDIDQLYKITKWMLSHGRGYEHLSAAGFQRSETPILADAIVLGKSERAAMRQAYEDVYNTE